MSATYRDGVWSRENATPIRPERFAADDEPQARAEQLTRLQASVVEATEATRRTRQTTSLVFEGMACGTAGANLVLRHDLGRVARWAVVDWTRTTPGGTHGLERSAVAADTNDENTLTLRSYVAGTASIEVW